LVNIFGEEIVWHGYALKRMELHFGKSAWLINGVLWNILVHFFIRWSYISLIPVSLIVPWICQKTNSFWPGVIIHGMGNVIVYFIIIPGVFS
jgi:membrane protease YdiL (CAAX protease family)